MTANRFWFSFALVATIAACTTTAQKPILLPDATSGPPTLEKGEIVIRPKLRPLTLKEYARLRKNPDQAAAKNAIEKFEMIIRLDIRERLNLEEKPEWPKIENPDPKKTRDLLAEELRDHEASVRPSLRPQVSTHDFWSSVPPTENGLANANSLEEEGEDDSLVYIFVDGHEICIESYELYEVPSDMTDAVVQPESLQWRWRISQRIPVPPDDEHPNKTWHRFEAVVFADVIGFHRD